MKAEELVEMDKPTLLGLIGQTQITKPETLLPLVVEMVKTLPNFDGIHFVILFTTGIGIFRTRATSRKTAFEESLLNVTI